MGKAAKGGRKGGEDPFKNHRDDRIADLDTDLKNSMDCTPREKSSAGRVTKGLFRGSGSSSLWYLLFMQKFSTMLKKNISPSKTGKMALDQSEQCATTGSPAAKSPWMDGKQRGADCTARQGYRKEAVKASRRDCALPFRASPASCRQGLPSSPSRRHGC
jgi:hypothetical protein